MPDAKTTLRGEWWGLPEDADQWTGDTDGPRPLVVSVRKATYDWLAEAAAKIRETEGAIFGKKQYVDVPNFGGAVLDGVVEKAVFGRSLGHRGDTPHAHSLQPDIDAVRAILDGKLIAFLEATPLEIGQAAALRALEYVQAVRKIARVAPGWRPPSTRGKAEKLTFKDLARLTYSDVVVSGTALWRAEQAGVVEKPRSYLEDLEALDRPVVVKQGTFAGLVDAGGALGCPFAEGLRRAHTRKFVLEGPLSELTRKPVTGVPLPPALALAFSGVDGFCDALGVTPGYHLARILGDVLGGFEESLFDQARERLEPTALAQDYAREGSHAADAAAADQARALAVARPDGLPPFDPTQFTNDHRDLPLPVRLGADGKPRVPGADPDWRTDMSQGYAQKLRRKAAAARTALGKMLY